MDEANFQILFKYSVAACLGGILGSFGTMLAHRLPRGLSIITPRSHCPQCKTLLGLCDLVPVLSYLAARGKCRHCKAPVPVRYLLIELSCVGIALIIASFI